MKQEGLLIKTKYVSGSRPACWFFRLVETFGETQKVARSSTFLKEVRRRVDHNDFRDRDFQAEKKACSTFYLLIYVSLSTYFYY